MNPFMVNLLAVKPPLLREPCWPLTPHAVPGSLSLQNPGGDTTNSSAQRGMVISGCPHALIQLSFAPAAGALKPLALLDPKGGEAEGREDGEVCSEAGHSLAGRSWSEEPWYLKGSIFCVPFSLRITTARYELCLKSIMGKSRTLASAECWRNGKAPSLKKTSLAFWGKIYRRCSRHWILRYFFLQSWYPTTLTPVDWARSSWRWAKHTMVLLQVLPWAAWGPAFCFHRHLRAPRQLWITAPLGAPALGRGMETPEDGDWACPQAGRSSWLPDLQPKWLPHPLSGQKLCFFLEPLQLWDAREHARGENSSMT